MGAGLLTFFGLSFKMSRKKIMIDYREYPDCMVLDAARRRGRNWGEKRQRIRYDRIAANVPSWMVEAFDAVARDLNSTRSELLRAFVQALIAGEVEEC